MVYLKRGADAAVVEKQLYEFTPLQSTVSIINIALMNHRPRTLTLRAMIQAYIDHRREVIRRRTEYLLREAKKNAHKLEGLIYAVCDIDEVIALIRGSRTRDEAIEKLIARRFRIPVNHPYAPKIPARLLQQAVTANGVALTRVQAEAIGALRLIQLVGLEIENLVADYAKIVAEIENFERILGDEQEVLKIVREDAKEMREKFGTPRLTAIEDSEADIFDAADLIQEHTVAVTISHQGYAKRSPIEIYREQNRGGKGIIGSDMKDEDFIEHLFVASTHDDLLCFTNTGRVFKMKVFQIPEMSRTSKGRAIVNLLELREGERVVAFLNIQDFEKSEDFLFFATASGKVNRTALQDYRNVHRTGIIAVGLNEGDQLIDVIHTTGQDHVLLATASGMSIRFDENDARVMGRNAAGVKGIELDEGDKVVGLIRVDDQADLLTVTVNGYGKRTALKEYLVKSEDGTTRPQSRGGKGRIDIKTSDRNGPVVAVRGVKDNDSVMFITAGGLLTRVPARSISQIGRNTQGVRLVKLNEGDRVIAAARIADGSAEDVAETPPPVQE